MVKVYLISYANKQFVKNQDRLNKSAIKYNLKNIISYGESDLKSTKFYSKYKKILDQPRGAGYWLWKPFFIYSTMCKLREGDILIYSDSGAVFIDNPLPLLKIVAKEKILLFTNNEPNIKWCKRKCLNEMRCNSSKYYSAPQISAGFQIYINNNNTRAFVKEWLYNCCKPGMIDNSKTDGGEFKSFIEHRHDQAILTNLAVKYNITFHRDPSQGGNCLKPLSLRKKGEWLQPPYVYMEQSSSDNYPTIINHLRNTKNIKLFLIKLHSKLPRWLKILLKRK